MSGPIEEMIQNLLYLVSRRYAVVLTQISKCRNLNNKWLCCREGPGLKPIIKAWVEYWSNSNSACYTLEIILFWIAIMPPMRGMHRCALEESNDTWQWPGWHHGRDPGAGCGRGLAELGASPLCMASGTGLHSGKLTRPGCSVSNFLKIGLI